MRDHQGVIAVVEAQLSQQGIIWPTIAAELGHRVVFLTNDPARYKKLPNFSAALERDDVDICVADTNSAEGVVAALMRLREKGALRAVYTQCDYNVAITAEAAVALGLPGLSPSAARKARNKLLARNAYREHGVPSPAFAHATTGEEAEQSARRVGLPCVVKPMTESASTDVALCWTVRDVLDRFAFITSQPLDRRGQHRTPGILVEEYCQGYEVSVETVTTADETKVLGVIDKSLGPHPYFTEIGDVFPSCLPDQVTTELVAVARAGLAAIGHDFGAAHTEIRMTADGPRLIEINARLCGAELPDLLQSALGIRLRHEVLGMHAGQEPDLTPRSRRGAAVRRFTAPASGALRAINGEAQARIGPGVAALAFDVKPGDIIARAVSNHEVLGHVRTVADTPAEAQRMADAAFSTISFEIG
ncbi:MAG TPA: ATP-grasp domain-containing protein [Trebonia sp.]|nr:ATP-grasp domain-containing protein [Trebonia sp.]